jgi:hypothetical protein
MPKLKINREDLIQALTTNLDLGGGAWYLDLENGQIILASDAVDDLPADLEDNPRYRLIETMPSHESFQIMEDFVETLEDEAAAERLVEALRRRKPFRQFKDALFDFPSLQERWFEFRDRAHARYAERWCKGEGIKAEWVDE